MTRYILRFISLALGAAALVGATFGSLPLAADEIKVAVAANFTAPARRIAAAFEKESGHRLLLSFGSTGKFYTQIKSGAPFQILLSADQETPGRLVKENSAVADSRFTYAIGRLVLWSATPGLVDNTGAVLKSDRFQHLAIANPKLAPYGRAAEETLSRLGLLDVLRPRFVQAENITQTHQFIAGGNAELGFIALSQVIGADGKISQGSSWIVPQNLYSPIKQDAVLLIPGKGKAPAADFLRYLKSEKSRDVIRSYGYAL